MFMYDTLIVNYGYTGSQVYVLYADGNAPNGGNCPDPEHAYSHTNVIDYSATKGSLQAVLTIIAGLSNGDTFIVIFTTGHGDHDDFGTPPNPATHVYFTTWGGDIRDDEFAGANYLGRITAYNLELIVMEQCYSGGFIDDLQNSKRIIYTAVDYQHVSYACDTEGQYDEFVYQLTCALHGATPGGSPASADSNGDHLIELYEAFVYAQIHDSRSENPQRYDPPPSDYDVDSYTHL